MQTIFGAQADSLVLALLIIVGLILFVLLIASLRHPVIVKLGVRNIPRRRMQSVLIIVGLALSTIITTSAMLTGDTLSYSLRQGTVGALGGIDEVISPFSLSGALAGDGGFSGVSDLSDIGHLPMISREQYERLRVQVKDDPMIDGLAPLFIIPGVIRNTTSGQGEPIGFIFGVGEEYDRQFGLHTIDGRHVEAATLRSGVGNLVQTASSLLGAAGQLGLSIPAIIPAGFISNTSVIPSGAATDGGLLGSNDLTSIAIGFDDYLGQIGLQLRRGEVYLSQDGAQKLDAHVGDELQVMLGPFPIPVRVKDIVVDAGPLTIAGPVVVMPISETQHLLSVLGLSDKYLAVAVSNKGDALEGVQYSTAVANKLRTTLQDAPNVEALITTLRAPDVRAAIDSAAAAIPTRQQNLIKQVAALRSELDQPGASDALRLLLADADLDQWLRNLPLPIETQTKVRQLLKQSNPLSVETLKSFALDIADQAGAASAQLFMFSGVFSLLAGVLLIFMVFVMLAAARKSEMGIARAVGTQRRHLIQMFVTEGAVYDLVAALVGVIIGVAVSYVMVRVIANIVSSIGGIGSIFVVQFHAEPRSLLIALCLGLLITFAVVTFSAWRVSRLNIVSAIRDLPEDIESGHVSWPRRVWAAARGPLALVIGWLIVNSGQTANNETALLLGVSLAIIGLGLTANTLLKRTAMRAARRDRLVYSFIGIALLLVWAVPWASLLGLKPLTRDTLYYVVAGLMMIAGAIWTVMYNADVILWLINLIFGRLGTLAPVLKTATAYPVSSRFRTGMAMAMFAIVIFLVITMSIVISTQLALFTPDDKATAGFDIRATTFASIPDLNADLQKTPDVPLSDIVAIGHSAQEAIEARQVGAARQTWATVHTLIGVDAGYLDQATGIYTFKARGAGYDSNAAVWQALRERDDVIVVPPTMLPRAGLDASTLPRFFFLEGVADTDTQLPPLQLELRRSNTEGSPVTTFQVIGILEQNSISAGSDFIAGERALQRLAGKAAQPNTQYVKVREGADARTIAQALEKAFQLKGMDAKTYEDINLEAQSSARAVLQLLQGFMALGLLVGIAALGVISTRTVVERRQQIGMLRAIGYQPQMVGLSFVLESSFVSVWGILIGVILGLVLSANMVSGLNTLQAGITFAPPWGEILLIAVVAYGFSLLTTIAPAYQASRIFPAEALRYE